MKKNRGHPQENEHQACTFHHPWRAICSETEPSIHRAHRPDTRAQVNRQIFALRPAGGDFVQRAVQRWTAPVRAVPHRPSRRLRLIPAHVCDRETCAVTMGERHGCASGAFRRCTKRERRVPVHCWQNELIGILHLVAESYSAGNGDGAK